MEEVIVVKLKKEFIRDPLNRNHNVRQRYQYIDYDYLSELNEEERDWLARATKEIYGADFDISPTYIIISDDTIKAQNNVMEKAWLNQFKKGTIIQISKNESRLDNRDLRKYRKVVKYYRDEDGELTNDIEYKYSSKNIHKTKEMRSLCNSSTNSMDRDLLNLFIKLGDGEYASDILAKSEASCTTKSDTIDKFLITILSKLDEETAYNLLDKVKNGIPENKILEIEDFISKARDEDVDINVEFLQEILFE